MSDSEIRLRVVDPIDPVYPKEITISREMTLAEARGKYPTVEIVAKWPEARQIELSKVLARVGFCGCGSSEKWRTMRLLLDNAETHVRSFYDEDLKPGEIGWWEFAANCLDSFKLIDHGTGIGYPWLTDDGRLLLEFLREFPDGNYPEWVEGDI